MRSKTLLIVLGVVLLVLAGCGKPSTTACQEQKQTLQVYLEGLKDKDFAKLQKTTNPRVFSGWPQDPVKLREYLTKNQQTTGNFKSWQFEKEPYLDTVNDQAIIRTTLVTDKYRFEMEYDLRKFNNLWGVYGVNTVKQVALQKAEKKNPTKMTP